MLVVRHQDRRLLGFHWNHTVYSENCLPFGLRTAPFLFNLFAEGLHWMLECQIASLSREELVLLLHYLDDFIFILSARASPWAIAAIYNLITDHLGVPRNSTKNQRGTRVEVLGFVIDTSFFFVCLSSTKQRDLVAKITSFLAHTTVTLDDCMSLAGSLNHAAFVVTLGRSFSASLWDLIVVFNRHPRSQKLSISDEMQRDLRWWSDALVSSMVFIFSIILIAKCFTCTPMLLLQKHMVVSTSRNSLGDLITTGAPTLGTLRVTNCIQHCPKILTKEFSHLR